MTRKKATAATVVIGLAAVAAACFEKKLIECPTSPTGVTQALALTTGNWTCAAVAAPSSFGPGSCGNAEWQISSMTGSSVSGTFKATCGGGLTLNGSAEGKLGDAKAEFEARGTVSGAGTDCAFSLEGTAAQEGPDAIRLTYSGSTCLGPISGCETLKKK